MPGDLVLDMLECEEFTKDFELKARELNKDK
jgi:hypothetical protein